MSTIFCCSLDGLDSYVESCRATTSPEEDEAGQSIRGNMRYWRYWNKDDEEWRENETIKITRIE